jgi:hypothetical protein
MNMRLLTEKNLAERWGYSPNTLRKWRVEGRGPDFIKLIGRGIRYDLDVIEAIEIDSRRSSTSDNNSEGQS